MSDPVERITEVSGLGAVYGPYSNATRVGRMIFVSGRVAPQELWESSVGEQTEAVMGDIEKVLGSVDPAINAGNIAMTNVYLPQDASFKEFNEAYTKSFQPGKFPARACVRAEAPIDGPRVEISAIATMSLGTWVRVAMRGRGLWPSVKPI